MANRYWVGGTAAWDGTAGTKWAATSGGAGGETVPTTADDVFFDANSTGTVTISTGNTGAKSINCTGFTGGLTVSANITVAGSITFVSGMTLTLSDGIVTVTGSGTITSGGKLFGALTINGSGITVDMGDALSLSGNTFTLTAGTFNTNNYNFTVNRIGSSGTATRAINLGSSTVLITGGLSISFSGSGYTFNAGTSSITITAGSGSSIDVPGATFYNVSFTNTSSTIIRRLISANTYNNLTLPGALGGFAEFQIEGNQTVNGVFTAGGSASERTFVRSNSLGTARTITAASLSANDCDFRDITIAGGAAGSSPTRAGNCGGNSGITFPSPKTVYRVGTSTSWAGSSSWALTSGGTGSDNNIPLAQDTAVIDNNTTLTGTLNISPYNMGALNCSSRTTAVTLNYGSSANWHGSHTLSSAVTVSGTGAQTFVGRGTTDFTSAGRTITFPLTVDALGGTFRLLDAFNSSNSITFTQGTFNANNYNVTFVNWSSNNSNVRTLTMGSGLWTLTGTDWSNGTATNMTLNKDTANILFSREDTAQRTFNGGGLSYNKLTIGGPTGTAVFLLNGAGTSFTELASTKTVAHTIRFVTSIGTIGTWSVTGTSGNVVTVDSSLAGTRRNFTLTNPTSGINYLNVRDIGELSGFKFAVGANSIDSGNNFNVYFTAVPPEAPKGNMLIFFD